MITPASPYQGSEEESPARIEYLSNIPQGAGEEQVIVPKGSSATVPETITAIQSSRSMQEPSTEPAQPPIVEQEEAPISQPPMISESRPPVRVEPVFNEGTIRRSEMAKTLGPKHGPSFLRHELPETVNIRDNMNTINRMSTEKDIQPAEYLTDKQWQDLGPVLSLSPQGKKIMQRHMDEKTAVDQEIKALVDKAEVFNNLADAPDIPSIQKGAVELAKKYRFAGQDYIMEKAKRLAEKDEMFGMRNRGSIASYNARQERLQKSQEKVTEQKDRLQLEAQANRDKYASYLMSKSVGMTKEQAETASDPATIRADPKEQARYEQWAGTHESQQVDIATGKTTIYKPADEVKKAQQEQEAMAEIAKKGSAGVQNALNTYDATVQNLEAKAKTVGGPVTITLTGEDIDTKINRAAKAAAKDVEKNGTDLGQATAAAVSSEFADQPNAQSQIAVQVAQRVKPILVSGLSESQKRMSQQMAVDQKAIREHITTINKDWKPLNSAAFADEVDAVSPDNYEEGIDQILRVNTFPGATPAEKAYIENGIDAIRTGRRDLYKDLSELRTKIAQDYLKSVTIREEEKRKYNEKIALEVQQREARKQKLYQDNWNNRGLITYTEDDPNDNSKFTAWTFRSVAEANQFKNATEPQREQLIAFKNAEDKRFITDKLESDKLIPAYRSGYMFDYQVLPKSEDTGASTNQKLQMSSQPRQFKITNLREIQILKDRIAAEYAYTERYTDPNNNLYNKAMQAVNEFEEKFIKQAEKDVLKDVSGDNREALIGIALGSVTPEEFEATAKEMGYSKSAIKSAKELYQGPEAEKNVRGWGQSIIETPTEKGLKQSAEALKTSTRSEKAEVDAEKEARWNMAKGIVGEAASMTSQGVKKATAAVNPAMGLSVEAFELLKEALKNYIKK